MARTLTADETIGVDTDHLPGTVISLDNNVQFGAQIDVTGTSTGNVFSFNGTDARGLQVGSRFEARNNVGTVLRTNVFVTDVSILASTVQVTYDGAITGFGIGSRVFRILDDELPQTVDPNGNTLTVPENNVYSCKYINSTNDSSEVIVEEGAELQMQGNVTGEGDTANINNAFNAGTFKFDNAKVKFTDIARTVWPSNVTTTGPVSEFTCVDGELIGPEAPAWSSTTTYATGDIVTYQGFVYTAQRANTNVTPPRTTANADWDFTGGGNRTGLIFHLRGTNSSSTVDFSNATFGGIMTIQHPAIFSYYGVTFPESAQTYDYRVVINADTNSGEDVEWQEFADCTLPWWNGVFEQAAVTSATHPYEVYFTGPVSMFSNIEEMYGTTTSAARDGANCKMIRGFTWNPRFRDVNDVTNAITDVKLRFPELATGQRIVRPTSDNKAQRTTLVSDATTSVNHNDAGYIYVTGEEDFTTNRVVGNQVDLEMEDTATRGSTTVTLGVSRKVRVWSFDHAVTVTGISRGEFAEIDTEHNVRTSSTAFDSEHHYDWAVDDFLNGKTLTTAPSGENFVARDTWSALKRDYYNNHRVLIPAVPTTDSITHDAGVSVTHGSAWNVQPTSITMNLGNTYAGHADDHIFTETTSGTSTITLKSGTTYSNYELITSGANADATLSGVTFGDACTVRVGGTATCNASTAFADGTTLNGEFTGVAQAEINGCELAGGSSITINETTGTHSWDDITLTGSTDVTVDAPAGASVTIRVPDEYRTGGSPNVVAAAGGRVTIEALATTETITIPHDNPAVTSGSTAGYYSVYQTVSGTETQHTAPTAITRGTAITFDIDSDTFTSGTDTLTIRIKWNSDISGTTKRVYQEAAYTHTFGDGDYTVPTPASVTSVLVGSATTPATNETFTVTDDSVTTRMLVTVTNSSADTAMDIPSTRALGMAINAANDDKYFEIYHEQKVTDPIIEFQTSNGVQWNGDYVQFASGDTDASSNRVQHRVRQWSANSAASAARNTNSEISEARSGATEILFISEGTNTLAEQVNAINEATILVNIENSLDDVEADTTKIMNGVGYLVSDGGTGTTKSNAGTKLVGIKPKRADYDSSHEDYGDAL